MKEQRKNYCSGKRLWWLVLIGMTTFSPGIRAASVDAAASRAAMQLLKAECFSCHNGEKHKGGLVLSARERLLEGGDSGAVIVPGKPDASLLVKALGKDADPHMPPKKQLTDAQVRTIREWVKRGAAWNDAALIEEEPVLPVRMENLPAGYLPVMALALSPDEQKIAVGRGGRLVIHEVGKTNFPVANEWSAGPDAVQAALASLQSNEPKLPPSPDLVIEVVCRYFALDKDALLSKSREKRVAYPRQIAMYLMRELAHRSLMEIGAALGGRDHSTVHHGWRKMERSLAIDPETKRDVSSLREMIEQSRRIA